MRSILFLGSVLFCATLATADLAGMSAAIDKEVIYKAKNYIVPIVLDQMNGLVIDQVKFSDGHVDDIKL